MKHKYNKYIVQVKRYAKNGLTIHEISSVLEIPYSAVEYCLKQRKGHCTKPLKAKMKYLASNGATIQEIRKQCQVSYAVASQHTKNERAEYRSKNPKYKLVAPDGTIYLVNSVLKFCKEHGLRPNRIYELLSNDKSYYKGWASIE